MNEYNLITVLIFLLTVYLSYCINKIEKKIESTKDLLEKTEQKFSIGDKVKIIEYKNDPLSCKFEKISHSSNYIITSTIWDRYLKSWSYEIVSLKTGKKFFTSGNCIELIKDIDNKNDNTIS